MKNFLNDEGEGANMLTKIFYSTQTIIFNRFPNSVFLIGNFHGRGGGAFLVSILIFF